MPQRKKSATAAEDDSLESVGAIAETARPRLQRLGIQNLGCIGQTAVTVDLNEIVVLVGPNNAGKSTILRAYELAMSEGSAKAKLAIDDFPRGCVDSSALPTIELSTVVFDSTPGARWIDSSSGEQVVRERWVWEAPGVAPKRQGWDAQSADWASDGVPWGAANVANSRRPQPHRIDAFAKPETQAQQVSELLLSALKEKLKGAPTEIIGEDGTSIKTDYGQILDTFAQLQRTVVEQAETTIKDAESQLTKFIGEIFRGYRVEFDAKPEEDLASALSFFKAGAQLRMGPAAGFLSAIDRQGSGARRALMWAALRFITENAAAGKPGRPNLLLLDEPELCLHPNAIRDACRVLYDLPSSGSWQVMVTTHSPLFVDLSRDNTTIVRVERDSSDQVSSTTVFRPDKVRLDPDEKAELKLLNLCDPHFAEFFFGGRTVLVEGDTEYTAFNHVRSVFADSLNVHVVRARGKPTLALLARILNQFAGSYAVLHDCDAPKTTRTKNGVTQAIANPAWTNNSKIRDEVLKAAGPVRLVATLGNFELAVFGEEADGEKPYNAKLRLCADTAATDRVRQLVHALVDHASPLPDGFLDWNDIGALEHAYTARYASSAQSVPMASTSAAS
jgi:putative ATP-dependent endonuclease of the OLD family